MNTRRPQPEEVEHLLRNAQLRDEMEPYLDEAIRRVNVQELTTPVENEFLASMLAWERAPVLPIGQWFTPELRLPHPDTLSSQQLHELLWETIHQLFAARIVLDFTDHLSDRGFVHADLSRHSAVAGKENRRAGQLSALGLRERGRRSGDLAALLRLARRIVRIGPSIMPGPLPDHEDPPVSARAAPPAAVGIRRCGPAAPNDLRNSPHRAPFMPERCQALPGDLIFAAGTTVSG